MLKPFCFFVLLFLMSICHAQGQQKKNVLFICVDDLRPNIKCYGDKYAITPNIDRLASEGMLFERTYCQQALCAPSRASIMTGMRPDTLPILSEKVHFRTILPDVITLPQLFKEHGYHAQAFGKVYHAYPPQPDPISWTVPERLLDIPKRDEYLLPINRVRGFIDKMAKGTATESVEAPDNSYQDGQVAQAAIETLDTIRNKPFFLAVGFKRPHLPFTCPKKYWDLYSRNEVPLPNDMEYPEDPDLEIKLRYDWQYNKGEMRNYTDIPTTGDVSIDKARELIHGYYACVSYVDAQIGRVIQALDSFGLRKNTIIILWADHGYHLGERGIWGKKDNTEIATRVPLIISIPAMEYSGVKNFSLVELVDIYPTLAELCGLIPPSEVQGSSMVPIINNPNLKWKEGAFSSFPRVNGKVMGKTIRTKQFRYTEYRDTASGKILDQELYNISRDPFQKENLVKQLRYKKVVENHQALLRKGWRYIASEIKRK